MEYVWKIYVAAWISAAVVICTALYFTRSAWCVWGLCLPAMLSYSSNGGKEDKADSKQTEHEL